jgi:hypothetical protein
VKSTRTLLALGLALTALQSCSCDDAPDGAVTRCDAELRPGGVATDVLFVIDESESMDSEQQILLDGLEVFVRDLVSSPIRNEVQVGITTTSVVDWDGGGFYTAGPNWRCDPATAGCATTPFPDGTLVAVARAGSGDPIVGELVWSPADGFGGARVLSAGSATIASDFGANVRVGISGSGKEQPFLAARHALEKAEAGGPNAGFLRPGARLAVVFLSDEDDCSDSAGRIPMNSTCHDLAWKGVPPLDTTGPEDDLDPVAAFAGFLDGALGGEARHPIVAAIAGFDTGTLAATGCATSFDDPVRFEALLAAVGPDRAVKGSICDADFALALRAIADRLVPQTVPLEEAPPDWRMLVAGVTREDGTPVPCPVALAGSPEAAAAGAIFTPSQPGSAAALTFQGPCVLRARDRIDLRIVCAG